MKTPSSTHSMPAHPRSITAHPFFGALALLSLAACTKTIQDKPVQNETTSVPGACGELAPPTGTPALQFSARPRNLLILSIDTFRRDRIGFYNNNAVTPFLDTLLPASVVLHDLRSCSNWTLPAMTCLVSGQSTLDLGLEPLAAGEDASGQVPADLPTLASWLSEAGYHTSLVSAAYLFSDALPTTNGFQQQIFLQEPTRAETVVTEAVAQLRTFPPGKNWYLHLHFRDPHVSYNPPEAYQGALAGKNIGVYDPRTANGVGRIIHDLPTMSEKDRKQLEANVEILYRGEIQYLDTELARLWKILETEGALDDTLVLIVSDHGEQNFEHGKFLHAQSLHAEEGMIVGAFWSKTLEPLVFSGPVSQPDLAPTILDALGLPVPDSVTGAIVGSQAPDRVRWSTASDSDERPTHTVDRRGIRLLYSWSGERHAYRYDLDPTEQKDIYDANNPDIQCLWDFLTPVLGQVDEARAGGPPVSPTP